MEAILIVAKETEFTNKNNELVKGWNLIFLNEQDEIKKYFVSNDNLKGFEPEMLAKVTGKTLLISTNVKTFDGRMREVLSSVNYK